MDNIRDVNDLLENANDELKKVVNNEDDSEKVHIESKDDTDKKKSTELI